MMKRMASGILSLLAASLLLPLSAHAQLFRAYLASYGNDGNPCVVSAPCRLVPAALAAVHDGGEIWMLDSANFNSGTVNISKSVSILAVPGQVGSIVAVASSPAVSYPMYQYGAGAVMGSQGNNLARGFAGNAGTITAVGSM